MVAECCLEGFECSITHLAKRQTAGTYIEAHEVECSLCRNGVDIAEKSLAKIEIFKVKCCTFLGLALVPERDDVVSNIGSNVSKNGNSTLCTDRKNRNVKIVAAGINAESTDTVKYRVESVRQNAFSFSNRRETKDKTIPSPHEIKRNLTNIVEIIYPHLLCPVPYGVIMPSSSSFPSRRK